MRRRRSAIVSGLVAGILATGCESARNPHEHGGTLVREYRPQWTPVERKVAGSGVYVLWRWEPLPPPTSARAGEELLATAATRQATTRPAMLGKGAHWERAIEVEQVFVQRGQDVGFRRRRADGQLIAVAGPTTRALSAGHYCWHQLPSTDTLHPARRAQAFDRTVTGALVAVVVVAAGVVLGYWDQSLQADPAPSGGVKKYKPHK